MQTYANSPKYLACREIFNRFTPSLQRPSLARLFLQRLRDVCSVSILFRRSGFGVRTSPLIHRQNCQIWACKGSLPVASRRPRSHPRRGKTTSRQTDNQVLAYVCPPLSIILFILGRVSRMQDQCTDKKANLADHSRQLQTITQSWSPFVLSSISWGSPHSYTQGSKVRHTIDLSHRVTSNPSGYSIWGTGSRRIGPRMLVHGLWEYDTSTPCVLAINSW